MSRLPKKENEKMELKTVLDEELAKRFETVKKHTGLNHNNHVLAFLISEEYGRIQSANHRRIFVANETYVLLEKTAEAHGQTVEEFVEAMIERNTKEGVKHGD